MPLETGAIIRLVIINDQGRYETISLEELIERSDNYVVDVIINNNLHDKYLLHHQAVSSKHWVIYYDFGSNRKANIKLLNDNFEEIVPHDVKIDATRVDVYFRQSVTGYAILN